MAQKKLGGGRNWLKKVGRREKLAQKVGRREIYPPVPPLGRELSYLMRPHATATYKSCVTLWV